MNKEELEIRIKGLEGLVESQRETIRDLSEKNIKVNDEIRETKRQYEEKEKYYFNIEEDYNDSCFKMELSKKEAEVIFGFLERLNAENTHFYISVLKEVYKYEW